MNLIFAAAALWLSLSASSVFPSFGILVGMDPAGRRGRSHAGNTVGTSDWVASLHGLAAPKGTPKLIGSPRPRGRGQARPVGTLESVLVPRPKIVSSAKAYAPEFGASVALDPGGAERAPLAYVGVPRAGVDGGARGAVQIFRAPDGRSGHWLDGWGHLVEGRGLAVGARFGASIAASEGIFAVGAPGASGPGGERSGLVRIYAAPCSGPGVVHRPRLVADLDPPLGSTGAAFGETLAVETSAKGRIQRLAVGAPYAAGLGPQATALAGRVFVYRRDPGGAFALDFEAVAPEPRVAATFGAAMAFAGGHLLVGAPGDGQLAPGAGRVFGFGPQGRLAFELAPPQLSEPGAAGARFGSSLCSVGERGFAVSSFGRGLVEVFRFGARAGSHPIHEQALHGVTAHRFGTSLAACGPLLLVGAPGSPAAIGPGPPAPAVGQVHVFARQAGVWRPAGALRSAMPGRNGEFGSSVVGAGHYSIVGEPGSHGACPDGDACMAGLGAVFGMPR